ncbi:MAG: leader peptidase (prepilin peptidase) / N-methyltransferase [Thermoleophilaceae bacterium]|jgi:leader peptidase (prepilin peptidase)/N-methyltransferase|nr:leader peptidase (prepilin peptidase) / N-methyltransferase [Thermoleophilaceae bacterium]
MSAVVDAAVAVLFVAALAAISVVDIRRRIVPNRIVLPAAAVVLVARTIVHPSVVWLASGLGAALFLLIAAAAKPGGMGMGDVKLALLLGFAVGSAVPVALFAALVAAALPSALLLMRHGARGRSMTIPFGPFLALGGVIALVAGGPLLDAYVGML